MESNLDGFKIEIRTSNRPRIPQASSSRKHFGVVYHSSTWWIIETDTRSYQMAPKTESANFQLSQIDIDLSA